MTAEEKNKRLDFIKKYKEDIKARFLLSPTSETLAYLETMALVIQYEHSVIKA